MNPSRAHAGGRPRRARRGGFTLIELMVAIAITALLLGIVLQVTTSMLHTWQRQRGILRKNLDARAAIELMTNDLRAIVIRPHQLLQNNLPAEWVNMQVVDTQSTITAAGGYVASPQVAWLMFFTVPIDRTLSLPGDVCAVSYRLGYEDPITSASGKSYPMMGLYRHLVPMGTSTAGTFGAVLGLSDLYGGFWKGQGSGSADYPLQAADFLIAHVIDFQVIFRAQNPDGTVVDVPASSTFRLADAISVSPPLAALNASARLVSIDLLITLVNEETAQSLRQVSSQTVQQQLVRQNAQNFTRRVLVSYGN